ncbi:Ig-like domain-containing protein [Neobacillus sp. OS1-33]|uniref:Ig-like domain-containing protein n=1 Tax=Neobacillus sp. OS1-33 TaxID=3070683 RepID=UPI0027E21691|nr:Ig-like domain-containing protein [Neobacillus sp. OS1-33]WML24728.1 Ig-like domain-containing protein [Neobacillus sp. OS1-33]
MKTPFRQRTINLILASSITLTPFAANLAFVPNTAHADSGIELVTFHNEIFKKLTASDIADIKVSYNNISKVNFNTILGTSLIEKIDTKTAPGTAIKLATDFVKLQYISNSADFLTALDAFKSNYSDEFTKIFDGKLSVDQALSLSSTFEENLKAQLVDSFLKQKNLSYDQILKAAVDSTLTDARFAQFDGIFSQKLGISVANILTMKTNVDSIVDPSKMASAALSSGLIRSKGGDIFGASTYTLGATSPSYSLKVDLGLGLMDFTNSLKWNTNNTSIATLTTGNKLVAKKTGKVKVVGYYLNQPIITKEITILPKKDTTAPGIPTVYSVDNNDKIIKGKAEAGSTITIKNGKTTVAIGKTASNGTFSISIKVTQKAGSVLTVTAKDAAGNESKAKSIKVLDKTAPTTPTVYSIDNNDKTIKGKAEANSYITIKNGSTTIATGKTTSKGTFSLKIKKAQKAGSTIYVTAKDAAGNVSTAKSTKVLDRVAPVKPSVFSVDSNDKVIKGKAEAGSTITIKKGSTVLASGKSSSKGNFSVKIKAQKKGTVLYVTATDKSKNVSSRTKVTVKSN